MDSCMNSYTWINMFFLWIHTCIHIYKFMFIWIHIWNDDMNSQSTWISKFETSAKPLATTQFDKSSKFKLQLVQVLVQHLKLVVSSSLSQLWLPVHASEHPKRRGLQQPLFLFSSQVLCGHSTEWLEYCWANLTWFEISWHQQLFVFEFPAY